MAEATRRQFLAGAAGAAAAAGLAASAGAAGTARAAGAASQAGPYLPEAWDRECDVLVVGAGGAGCAAAYGAASAGAQTLVIESQGSNIATSTAICGGYTYFVCSGLQEEQGIEDSPDLFVSDTMAYGQSCREDVLRVFAEENPKYYDLVTNQLGLAWTGTVNLSPGCSVPRTLICDPSEHQEKIFNAAQDAGAEFLFNTEGRRLYVDASGAVVGVEARGEDGADLAVKARKGVILASGGFTHNPDMLEECMPGAGEIPAHSCEGHTGLMHQAAMQVGCQMFGRPWVYATEAKYPGYVSMEQYAELYIYGAAEVNVDGERYVDESIYWCNDRTRALLQQPKDPVDGICSWEVFDQPVFDAAVAAGPPIGLQQSTIDLLVSADSWEELGEKINAPALAETMERYNSDIEQTGADTVLGRTTLLGEGTGAVVALTTPPFYAFKNAPHFDYDPATSFYVDTECAALDTFGEPVPGLYMVGEIMLRTVVGNHYQYGLATGAGGTLGLYCGGLVAGKESRE